jgi:hypothetical protein
VRPPALGPGPERGFKKKFNTLVLEGLDLLLKDHGLPNIQDLTSKTRYDQTVQAEVFTLSELGMWPSRLRWKN